MARYQIIDEPRTRPWGEHIIVDPVVILFAAILIPLFWNPPYLGRFWMPLVWLIVNGYALGSSTLRKEVIASILGVVGMYLTYMLVSAIHRNGIIDVPQESIVPYLRLMLFALFFFTLYFVVTLQGVSHSLYKYTRGEASE